MMLTTRREPLARAAGWAVLGVFVVFVAAGFAQRVGEHPAVATAAMVAAIGFAAVTILGRTSTALPAAAVAGAGVAVLGHGMASNVCWFGLCVLAAWAAMTLSILVVGVYWLGSTLLLLAQWLFTTGDPGWAAWIGGLWFSVVGCWFAGRQHDLVIRLREAQAGLAGRAQAEERNRIARELHDVIAHSLTVSLLHVASARLALDDDPAEAARALAEAERLGRDSLDEVRHAVGLLRREGESDPTAPLPGTVDVDALLTRFRSAGARIDARIEGDLSQVPATVGLATYRILQEALTNAAKHSPGGSTTVDLTLTDRRVRLTVDSAGEPGTGAGLGLLGMRERASALGGACEAGPGGSGWLVRAQLPLDVAVEP